MSAGTHAGLDATVKVTASWGEESCLIGDLQNGNDDEDVCSSHHNFTLLQGIEVFFLLYSHAMCTTSLKVITWPGQKGERISSRERSDGPKSSLTGCTNTSGGAPPCDSLPRQTIVQSLEQHWVDKSRRKRLGGPGELTVSHSFFFFLLLFFFCSRPIPPTPGTMGHVLLLLFVHPLNRRVPLPSPFPLFACH